MRWRGPQFWRAVGVVALMAPWPGDGSREHKLYLGRAIDNRGVTPVVLRQVLESLQKALESTAKVWNPSNLKPSD